MMVKYHKTFEKQFKKLSKKLKEKTINTIDIFINNHKDKRLLNHKLKGTLIEKRAIYVSPDLRIIFEEIDDYALVVFLDIGNHRHIYK